MTTLGMGGVGIGINIGISNGIEVDNDWMFSWIVGCLWL